MAFVNLSASKYAAQICGNNAVMDVAALTLAGRAKANLAPHRKSGSTSASIAVSRVRGRAGVTDRLVTATGEGVLSIEFGHKTKSGKRVPGIHFMRNAIRSLPSVD